VRHLALALAVVAGGCGYTSVTENVGGIDSIYISTLANRTFEHELGVSTTDAIIRECIYDGQIEVSQRDEADAVLTGEVSEYILDPVTYGTVDADVRQYRVRIDAKFTLVEARTGRRLWLDKVFSGDETYFVSGRLARPEEAARDGAVADLAKRVVLSLNGTWQP